jgi:hypothetical protein
MALSLAEPVFLYASLLLWTITLRLYSRERLIIRLQFARERKLSLLYLLLAVGSVAYSTYTVGVHIHSAAMLRVGGTTYSSMMAYIDKMNN